MTLGGDSDDDNDDDLLTENSETECTETTVSTDGVLPLQPNFQSGSDSSQPSSQMSNGNLKKFSPVPIFVSDILFQYIAYIFLYLLH